MSDGDAQLDKIAGAAKEAAGKVTGDKDLEAEGTLQKAEGKVKDAVEDAKAGLSALGERLKDAVERDK